ncbi:MAG: MarR family winged helix-turn-helix transcriptional regulator [Sporomusa sp.]
MLWKNDSISISKLAAMTMLGNSTLTSMLDRLEDSGYFKRCCSSTDRRSITIMQTIKIVDCKKYTNRFQRKCLIYFMPALKTMR